GFSGFIVDAAGYGWFFAYTAMFGIPALIILYILRRQDGRLRTGLATDQKGGTAMDLPVG
ncbi:MAG: hypothetical protein AAFY32_01990, partial [Pseudomonadota bacterium]